MAFWTGSSMPCGTRAASSTTSASPLPAWRTFISISPARSCGSEGAAGNRVFADQKRGVRAMTAFLALLRRDLHVASRNAVPPLVATLTQPIPRVLVFGDILPRLHLVAEEFRTVIVPGLMSITMLMATMPGVAFALPHDPSATPACVG